MRLPDHKTIKMTYQRKKGFFFLFWKALYYVGTQILTMQTSPVHPQLISQICSLRNHHDISYDYLHLHNTSLVLLNVSDVFTDFIWKRSANHNIMQFTSFEGTDTKIFNFKQLMASERMENGNEKTNYEALTGFALK